MMSIKTFQNLTTGVVKSCVSRCLKGIFSEFNAKGPCLNQEKQTIHSQPIFTWCHVLIWTVVISLKHFPHDFFAVMHECMKIRCKTNQISETKFQTQAPIISFPFQTKSNGFFLDWKKKLALKFSCRLLNLFGHIFSQQNHLIGILADFFRRMNQQRCYLHPVR